MNIYTAIQDAIIAFNLNVDVFIYEKSRDENEALDYENPVIVIFPDWKTDTETTEGMQLLKNRVYNIDFKTQDDWDNSDNDISKSYDQTSVQKIEEMEILADSVFSYISQSDEYSIAKKIKWSSTEPILRTNNGTMSGVKVRLTIPFFGTKLCV